MEQCFPKALFFNVLKRVYMEERVNSLPDDKILDWSKLKQIADDIVNRFQTSPGLYVSAVQVF